MSETALPSGDVWCWLISAAMAMADYDGHSQTMATSGGTALPLGGVVLVALDDQSVPSRTQPAPREERVACAAEQAGPQQGP